MLSPYMYFTSDNHVALQDPGRAVYATSLASFPGHSHLQSLIACSEEKAWEIWSHVMTSGRQLEDTCGVVPDPGVLP